ncbi:helix-turn-helix transcriptional regulator [Ktedonosporobacter rubrisoli]|nr:AraC family transcriptional regulator [Ktedonosporobacter rubrisoli]
MIPRRVEPGSIGARSQLATQIERSYNAEPLTHDHDYYQIVFPQHGFLSTRIKGKQEQFGGKCVLFLRPHLEHTFFASAPNRFLVFDLPVALIEGVGKQFGSAHALPGSHLLSMNQRFTAFCQLVNTEITYGVEEEPLVLEPLLQYLATLLFLTAQPLSAAPLTVSRKAVAQRMQEYIEAHYTEALTLQEIAVAIGASPSYAHRCFTLYAGISAVEYVQRLRLERAVQLLLSSDLSLGAISLAVGFRSQGYFTRLFSQKLGLSPSRYRDLHLQKERRLHKNMP